MEDITIMIPVGYVAIPLAVYDDLQARLHSLKEDFHDELSKQAGLIRKLNAAVGEKNSELEELRGELETTRADLKSANYKLFEASNTIISLKKEVALLNDELLRSDTVKEVNPCHE